LPGIISRWNSCDATRPRRATRRFSSRPARPSTYWPRVGQGKQRRFRPGSRDAIRVPIPRCIRPRLWDRNRFSVSPRKQHRWKPNLVEMRDQFESRFLKANFAINGLSRSEKDWRPCPSRRDAYGPVRRGMAESHPPTANCPDVPVTLTTSLARSRNVDVAKMSFRATAEDVNAPQLASRRWFGTVGQHTGIGDP